MTFFLKKISAYILSMVLILSGCAGTGTSGSENPAFKVGPQLSSMFDSKRDAVIDPNKPKLDVIVPVFDPGLPANQDAYGEDGVWPELRRAEANRFAYKLKLALEETGAFGAVRVTPDNTATGDLYVMGKIIESNGEDVEIGIDVVDISGDKWFTRYFDHTVDAGFHKNTRNDGKDPYDPVFEAAANRIALELEDIEASRLIELQRITSIRFGANFAEQAFNQHLTVNGNIAELNSYPSADDPMLQRVQAIRVRDQLFVDSLQNEYRAFSSRMEDSYRIWQEQAQFEILAERAANQKAAGEAALGILAIGLGILAVVAGSNSDNIGAATAGATGAVVAGTAGVVMLQKSFQTSEEAKVHRDALNELGESIDVDLGPRVVEFEKQTTELTGDAKEQFAQWRAFLQKIYAQERTPEKQL